MRFIMIVLRISTALLFCGKEERRSGIKKPAMAAVAVAALVGKCMVFFLQSSAGSEPARYTILKKMYSFL